MKDQFVAQYKRITQVVETDNSAQVVHNPIGIVLAVRNEQGEVKFGWSSCDKHDTFNKKKAVQIALNRAKKGSKLPIPSTISDLIDEKFLQRVEKYFQQPVNPPQFFVMDGKKKKLKTRVGSHIIDLKYQQD